MFYSCCTLSKPPRKAIRSRTGFISIGPSLRSSQYVEILGRPVVHCMTAWNLNGRWASSLSEVKETTIIWRMLSKSVAEPSMCGLGDQPLPGYILWILYFRIKKQGLSSWYVFSSDRLDMVCMRRHIFFGIWQSIGDSHFHFLVSFFPLNINGQQCN